MKSAPERGQAGCLGERRWRVLKNAGAEEGRWNPDGLQRWNLRKLNRGLRRRDEDRRVVLLVFACRDQRDGAFVGGADRLVHALVQVRRGGEHQGKEKSANECRPRWPRGERSLYRR